MTTAQTEGRVARWRIVAGIAVLAALVAITARLTPIYFHNQELQGYVGELAQSSGIESVPDPALRARVMEKAQDLGLPVREDNVRVYRSPEGVRIDVRYVVRVDLGIYAVDLHFYPGAGSR